MHTFVGYEDEIKTERRFCVKIPEIRGYNCCDGPRGYTVQPDAPVTIVVDDALKQ